MYHNKFHLYFIPVKNFHSHKYYTNMYVVKIIIYKGESNVLYSISTKSNGCFAYIKSQCCN